MLRAAIAAILLVLPLAAADEARPDCEDDQPLRTDPRAPGAREALEAILPARVCEGEHWDGQDTVRPESGGSCTGSFDPSDGFAASLCLGSDPNAHPGEDPLMPVGVRVSQRGSEAYAGANVAFVGRVALYAAAEGTLGIYWRDNTPGNFVAGWVEGCHLTITGCWFGDMDCDYGTWRDGVLEGDRRCGRDNTAVTAQLLA